MTRARSQAKKPDIPAVLVNSTALAWVFNITQRRVQQLAKDGVIPAPVKYQYNLVDSVRGYVSFLQAALEQQGSGSSNADLKKARVELLRAQRRAADLLHKEKTGQLLKIDDVEQLHCEAAAIYAGQLSSLGSRLSGQLAGMDDPKAILKLLNAEVDCIRQNTAAKFIRAG